MLFWMRSKTYMSKINLQSGILTVENRSREKKRICSEVSVNSPGNPWSQSRRRNGRLWWEGFAEKESFKPGVKQWRGDGWWEWWVDGTNGGSATHITGWGRIGEISAWLTENPKWASQKFVCVWPPRNPRRHFLESGAICFETMLSFVWKSYRCRDAISLLAVADGPARRAATFASYCTQT